ncbi:MAG: TGF-beta family protein [Myxococcota bacterium]
MMNELYTCGALSSILALGACDPHDLDPVNSPRAPRPESSATPLDDVADDELAASVAAGALALEDFLDEADARGLLVVDERTGQSPISREQILAFVEDGPNSARLPADSPLRAAHSVAFVPPTASVGGQIGSLTDRVDPHAAQGLCLPGQPTCCVHEYALNFANIGAPHIVLPASYNANYAAGFCPQSSNPNEEGHYHRLFTRMDPNFPNPDVSCVPTNYHSLSTIITDDDGFHLINVPDMIVTEAGCR